MEECVEALVGLYHVPCYFYFHFYATDNAPNNLQGFDSFLRIVVIVVPLIPF